jgi:hypothetical protein
MSDQAAKSHIYLVIAGEHGAYPRTLFCEATTWQEAMQEVRQQILKYTLKDGETILGFSWRLKD